MIHFATVISQMYRIETYSESSAKPKEKSSQAFQSYEPSKKQVKLNKGVQSTFPIRNLLNKPSKVVYIIPFLIRNFSPAHKSNVRHIK